MNEEWVHKYITDSAKHAIDLKGTPLTAERFKEIWEREMNKWGQPTLYDWMPLIPWEPEPIELLPDHLLPPSVKETGWTSPPIPAPKSIKVSADFAKLLQTDTEKMLAEIREQWNQHARDYILRSLRVPSHHFRQEIMARWITEDE